MTSSSMKNLVMAFVSPSLNISHSEEGGVSKFLILLVINSGHVSIRCRSTEVSFTSLQYLQRGLCANSEIFIGNQILNLTFFGYMI